MTRSAPQGVSQAKKRDIAEATGWPVLPDRNRPPGFVFNEKGSAPKGTEPYL